MIKMRNIIVAILCLMAFSANAQRCAVLEFKAGSGISQADVDGISAMFITYFRPAGYTMVERTQIEKVIEEQGFQRSRMTQAQMVRVGEILNVSKIVVGDINYVFGQYQVDARVINVETGTIAATEGATFATSSYRSSMQSVAQKLASKIAISPGSTVPAQTSSSSAPKTRTSVETLWGYLKIFPMELGAFSSEPTSVISNINAQAQYGYNNWRIPTNEELSLMRANNYLGAGEYMTRENKRGIVLLVSDGKDFATIQSEKEQERKTYLQSRGLVDLGLPSGTLWRDKNENGGHSFRQIYDIEGINYQNNERNLEKGNLYTYTEAANTFGNSIPTKEQWEELLISCQWILIEDNQYKVVGPSGDYILLPGSGWADLGGNVGAMFTGHSESMYWSSTIESSNSMWYLYFSERGKRLKKGEISHRYCAVRLVETK